MGCIAKWSSAVPQRVETHLSIVKDVANVKFSVLADDTSDYGHVEQLSLSLLFVKSNKIHEEYLCFVRLTLTTGEAPADCVLLTNLSQLVLDLNILRGKDAMEPATWAVHTEVCRQEYACCIHCAIYTYCCSHVLNLVVSGASQLPSIPNAMGAVASVRVYFAICAACSYSAKVRPNEHRHLVEKAKLYLCKNSLGGKAWFCCHVCGIVTNNKQNFGQSSH